VVGLGIRSTHLTAETASALRRCRRAFAVLPYPEQRRLLRARCGRVSDLRRLYVEGKDRRRTYSEMADAVIAGATSTPPVAFVVYGHPLVGSRPSRLIIERARRLGLQTVLLPAVSSLDCLIADLGVDPLRDGLQVFLAADLLFRRRTLQADVPCFIYQPVRRLKAHLLHFYPSDHEVVVAGSDMGPSFPGRFGRIRLGRLERAAGALHPATTLYVPSLPPGRSKRR